MDLVLENLRRALLTLEAWLATLQAKRASEPQPESAMPEHPPGMIQTEAGKRIYDVAKALLGQDASPDNQAPSNLACAETVNYIVTRALGRPVGGETSTYAMLQYLRANMGRWEQILPSESLSGDIIISPSPAPGTKGARLQHGHTGIVGNYGILSNNSETGKLAENYDITSWTSYFTDFGNLPTFCFRCVQPVDN